ncbi:MAG: thiamine pyrophosphate-dependent enzyme [Bacteroidales bacterium]|jgi:pyruvate/2-oxoglutarate/acetoin dehydrogenase E1 component/TPP-dependent pyruvate/acetoin dehydrogenase alpha subunit|nr:thiamine pyrophosphate-dependent enzyme [Bacteroidales bacterium]
MSKRKFDKEEVLADYKLACESRQVSLLGRREVLGGRANFGLFGDGKEVPQVVLAKFFREGDWRSGYYRDQTFMMAAGLSSLDHFFAQLYGDTDLTRNPDNGGRLMNCHFATRSLDEKGNWKDLTKQKNSSGDISPTAGQMPRMLGLALASKVFRNSPEMKEAAGKFTVKGNEVVFGMIGDASTSEGHFFETINAAGVLQVPMAISIWDDGYGISVPIKYQTTKEDISELLKGFVGDDKTPGIRLFSCFGWDYAALYDMYEEGIELCRKQQVPVVFHIKELTQPQGHSTSGSHERYKPIERLAWEKDHDCILRMRTWILSEKMATDEELKVIESEALKSAKAARDSAWKAYQAPFKAEREHLIEVVKTTHCPCKKQDRIDKIVADLEAIGEPIRRDIISAAKKIMRDVCTTCSMKKPMKADLEIWMDGQRKLNTDRYSSHLYSQSEYSALKVEGISPVITEESPVVTGREVLNANFNILFKENPLLLIFGEDVGKIGGVNQTLEGMQAKYGEQRVFDTGIREATIVGQGIGMALRGLRPIAEIQYFDYLLYGLQVISDDLATTHYRTRGGQKCPLIISTRGHRLVGIWHSGSALSMVLNAIRGIYVLVPRDMTQAAGFYNTMMASDDPALIIEPLNGYRLKERMPANIGHYRTPVGISEVLHEGSDITLVTYGSCVKIAQEALPQIADFGISIELIDAQSLLPFDRNQEIVKSLKKTNKILFFDEDATGGATAYMMQKVLEEHGGYQYLDATPRTLTANDHRPAYTNDGDYFSKPNAEDVFESIYEIMHEYNPNKYPRLW